MKCKIGSLVAMLLMMSLRFSATVVAASDAAGESPKAAASKTDEKQNGSTVSIQIKISAESKPSLPLESKIQWTGIDDTCKQIGEENKPIGPDGVISLKVPMCKIKIMIFITGFDTKTVTLDLAKNSEKAKDTVHIAVKRQGPPEVEW